MQLTNIIRDVPEDLRRNRLYLPQEELEQYGVSRESLRNGTTDDAFRSLMKSQIDRARGYFEKSEALFPLLRASSRYCPILLRKFYCEILDKIEASDYDVFSRRPSISRLRKTGLAVSIWIQSLLVRITD
jgi:phytoene synthase